MEIFKIAAIGIVTAICVLILREHKSETALLVSVSGGVLILLSVVEYFADIFSVMQTFMDKSGIPSAIYTTILKIVGVGYIAEFSAGIVEDAGQRALGEKILLAAKLMIMVLSLPILVMLFETVTTMMNG